MNDNKISSQWMIVMSYLGGALIFFGIAIFIHLNWSFLNGFMRVFVTLGVAIAAYFIALICAFDKNYRVISNAFFIIAGFILPVGLYVSVDLAGGDLSISSLRAMLSALCLGVFFISACYMRQTILVLFSILFGSLFYFDLAEWILYSSTGWIGDINTYVVMVLGVSYLLLGRYLESTLHRTLTGLLYLLGAFFVLGTSYSLGGSFWGDANIHFWKIMTAFLILLTLFSAIPLKSKALLYVGALFLIMYVADISSDLAKILGDRGWPLFLVLMGLALMLTGFVVVRVQKKIR